MPATLVQNIVPARGPVINAPARPRPLDFRTGGADTLVLAQEFKLRVNSSLTLDGLAALGAERLQELLSKVAAAPSAATNGARPLVLPLTPEAAALRAAFALCRTRDAARNAAADEFRGYSINDPET